MEQQTGFLSFEDARNRTHARLYADIMRRALGGGAQTSVLIGHHLGFEFNQDIETENEIPSADTLLFNHALMGKVFGDRAVSVMVHLAMTPTESRDAVLADCLACLDDPREQVYPVSGFEMMEVRRA